MDRVVIVGLTEIVLTVVLGAVGGLISFEIWGWLPNVTRALDEARRQIAADEPPANPSERFSERRVTGVAWSASQLTVAFVRQVRSGRHRARRLDMAAYGSVLGGMWAISYIAASLLVGGAPTGFRIAVEQVGAWGGLGALTGYAISHSIGLIRGG